MNQKQKRLLEYIFLILEMHKFRLFNENFQQEKDLLYPKKKYKPLPVSKTKHIDPIIIMFPHFFQKPLPDLEISDITTEKKLPTSLKKRKNQDQNYNHNLHKPISRNISTAAKITRQIVKQDLFLHHNDKILNGMTKTNLLLKSTQLQKVKVTVRCQSEHNQQQQQQQRIVINKNATQIKTNSNILKNQFIIRKSHDQINLLYDFLFAISLYNGVIYQKTINPKASITKGNNGTLVRQILKRRYWWSIKQEGEVHLLWSQKPKKSFPIQKSYGLSKVMTKSEIKSYACRSQNLKKLYLTDNNLPTKQQQPIFFSNKTQLSEKLYLRAGSEPKIHNHLPENSALSSKRGLYLSLLHYYKRNNIDISQRLPLTFLFQDSPIQIIEGTFNQIREQHKKGQKLWIVKPGQDTNRGNGIHITQQLQQIQAILKCRKKERTMIVQQYLRPYLYEGRKFDIRAYLLITIVDGKVKAYWYKQGYIRTSSFVFDQKQKSPFIHLTNDAIQKKHSSYGKFEGSNKISYEQFQKYLNEQKNNNSFNLIQQKMKIIATQLVQATYFTFNPDKLDISFQLFGLDFMINQNFKVFLIQANSNPCLQVSGKVLNDIIPNLLDNVFKIAVDPIFQPTQGKRSVTKCNPYQTNKFEIIFDQRYY